MFAALDVHGGEVLAEPIPGKNDSVNFCTFLDDIDRTVDPTLAIHVVLDNGSSHASSTPGMVHRPPAMARALHATARHWVNQVELFFSILQRKVIPGGNFMSRDDLITKLLAFIADYDQTARPFNGPTPPTPRRITRTWVTYVPAATAASIADRLRSPRP